MQHGVTGTVGCGTGALRGTLSIVSCHTAKWALIDFSVLLATRERQTPVLEFVNCGRCVAAEIFDSVLIAEPISTLDGVVHVPAPVILAHIAERGRDATLRRDGMRAGREHLGDTRGTQPCFAAANHGAQTGTARTDDDDIVTMILDRIGTSIDRWRAV